MTMRLQAEIAADGSKAKSELVAVRKATDDLTGALGRVTKGGAQADAALDAMGAEARQAEIALDAAANAAHQTAIAAQGVSQSHTLAAGSVANLTAQFNDVGMMLAAGQNPLMLAIQQGTQISQVLGPMGARGSVKALGAAFMSLLSPVNLVTLGVIAGGAALLQWAVGAGDATDKAEGYTDALEAMTTRTREAQQAVDLFQSGFATVEEMVVSQRIAALRSQIAGLRADANATLEGGDIYLQKANDLAKELQLQEQIVADLKEAEAAEARLTQAKQATRDAVQAGVDGVLQFLTMTKESAQALEKEADLAQSLSNDLAGQIWLQEQIFKHGEDSLQVSEARANLEREAFKRQVETQIAAQDYVDVVMQAYDAMDRSRAAAEQMAKVMAEADASGLRDQVNEIAASLGVSLQLALRIAQLGPQGKTQPGAGRGRGGDPRQQGGSTYDWQNRDAIVFLENWKPPRARRGGGGGGRAAKRDPAADLIKRYQQELAILREADPIQRELLRHRDALADATAQQRAEIERLIGVQAREEAAAEALAERYDFLRDTTGDLFKDLLKGGDAAAGAFDRLGDAIQDAAFEAILMGRGPLAEILGIGGGDGGLIGSLMGIFMPNATGGGAIPQNADGGMFYAPGSSRSDSGLSWLSSGEFIVNAAATTRNRALLETVNAGGDARAFASAPAAVHGRGSDGVVVQIINQTSSPIVEQSAEDRAPDGRRRVRFTLSEAVGDAISLPGGKARKTLATGFNLAPVGTAR